MNIGDSVFLKNRVSGVVIDKYPDGRVSIEQEGPTYDKTRKIGFINGLNPSERDEFFRVMNEIKSIEDPKGRYERLAGRIEELKERNYQLENGIGVEGVGNDSEHTPDTETIATKIKTNTKIIKYLQAELNHLASCKNIVPKIYTAEPRSL